MQTDPKAIRGYAICQNCPPGTISAFVGKIYSCGGYRFHYIACDQAWEAFDERGGEESDVSKAVGEGRDEPGHLV